MTKTVVIAGATGNLGTKLRHHFEGLGWSLRLIDRSNGGDPAVIEADLATWDDRWVGAFKQADAVILLAADPGPFSPWESIVRLNLDLTLNVHEAAVSQGAKRLIFASSNWTMGGYRFDDGPLPTDREPRPINAYGMSKLVGERLGRSYSERHSLSCISFRIGYCQRGDNVPGPAMAMAHWGQEMWLSNRDLCDGFEKAVTAPQSVRFAVLNLMSDNPGMRWDIETTRRTIGYAPKDGHRPVVPADQLLGEAAAEKAYAMIDAATTFIEDSRI
jgi:nucleoside-diphosphate-sugar epimerase